LHEWNGQALPAWERGRAEEILAPLDITPSPLGGGRWKKIEIFPLTLPSPARGEGKHVEIVKKFPPPRRGRARVGVILGNFSHLRGGAGRG